jgi:spermidine synthase
LCRCGSYSAILDAVNNRYGDFTGHLDQRPGINFVNDEGRAYVERSNEKYDILQIPFTDTWAATGAGAFALTENGLYTIDAFRTFIDHLSDNGILTVTRWYLPPQPIEAYRLTALAAESLRAFAAAQKVETDAAECAQTDHHRRSRKRSPSDEQRCYRDAECIGEPNCPGTQSDIDGPQKRQDAKTGDS